MLNAFRQKDSELDAAITYIYIEMRKIPPDTDDYVTMVEQLTKLYALKKKSVDPNVLLTVAGNIIIGIAVLQFEKIGIVTSKIWSFMQKI